MARRSAEPDAVCDVEGAEEFGLDEFATGGGLRFAGDGPVEPEGGGHRVGPEVDLRFGGGKTTRKPPARV